MPTLAMKINPFPLPESVTLEQKVGKRQDGLRPVQSVMLTDLPRSTVEELCDEFKSRMLASYDSAHKPHENCEFLRSLAQAHNIQGPAE